MKKERINSILVDIGLLYTSLIWGATFFVVKNVLDFVHPVTLVAYRFIIAAIILLVILVIIKKNPWANPKPGIILGVLMWFLYIFQTVGLKYTTASNSGFITGLFVLFVPILYLIIYKKLPPLNKNIAIVLCLVGLWILTGGVKGINKGDLLSLVAAVTYALHLIITDKYAKQNIDPYILSFQQFLVVGLLGLITAFVIKAPLGVSSNKAWFTLIFLAIFPTISAFIIQIYAQRVVTPIKASLIFALESPFAAIFAWTLGGEPFKMIKALGGLIIFTATIISELPFFDKKDE